MIALSGINTRSDVQNYETIGVKSVLVGKFTTPCFLNL